MGFQDIVSLRTLGQREPAGFLSIGRNDHGESLHIPQRSRSTHMYILGLSGSGKSKFLESLLYQDILTGAPFTLIDPKGSLYQETVEALAFVSRYHSQGLLKDPAAFWERFILLDFTSKSFPIRFNPLEASAEETTEDLVGDLMRAIARELVGDMNQTKRLEQILSNAFWVLAENVREGYPATLNDAYTFLLNEPFRKRLLSRLDTDLIPNLMVIQYWEDYFGGLRGNEQRTEIASSLNVLQYFWRSSKIGQFLDSPKSNLSFHDVLTNRRSLLVNVPMAEGTRNAGQILGTLIATKLQRTAMRRKTEAEKRKRHFLYIDEFHYFVDQDFAEALTVLREYGLSLVLAHQSLTQPPLNLPEGEGIVTTIKNNAFLKVFFRVGREDAEKVVPEVFRMTEKRVRREWEQVSVAEGESTGTSRGSSESATRSQQATWNQGQNWGRARQRATSITDQESQSRGRSLALSEQSSLTEGQAWGTTTSQGVSDGHARSRTSGGNTGWSKGASQGLNPETGELRSEGASHGASGSANWSAGATDSRQRSQAEGKSFTGNVSQATSSGRTETESESVTTGRARARSRGVSENEGFTVGKGASEGLSTMEGRSESRSEGKSVQVTRARQLEFHSLEGEKEFAIQDLQALPNRKAFIVQGGLRSEAFVTHTLPPHQRVLNQPFLERLLQAHQVRMEQLLPTEAEEEKPSPTPASIIGL